MASCERLCASVRLAWAAALIALLPPATRWRPAGFTLNDASGFVQFALGVGATTAFCTRLVSLGIPFAVTALALIVAWAAGGVLCGRTGTKLAASRWFTHPAQAVWLGSCGPCGSSTVRAPSRSAKRMATSAKRRPPSTDARTGPQRPQRPRPQRLVARTLGYSASCHTAATAARTIGVGGARHQRLPPRCARSHSIAGRTLSSDRASHAITAHARDRSAAVMSGSASVG